MQSTTPLHKKTAIFWALGSAMRGALSAREIVAKERTPSMQCQRQLSLTLSAASGLTDCRNDLRFQTKLIAESTSKVTNTPFSVTGYVWSRPDVIEHMPAGEQ